MLAVAFIVTGFEHYLTVSLWQPCAPERLERLPLANSSWAVEGWMAAYGFGIHSPLYVYAVNPATREKVALAAIDDNGHTSLSIDDDGNLVITLPYATAVSNGRDHFGTAKVIYLRQP